MNLRFHLRVKSPAVPPSAVYPLNPHLLVAVHPRPQVAVNLPVHPQVNPQATRLYATP